MLVWQVWSRQVRSTQVFLLVMGCMPIYNVIIAIEPRELL